MKKLVSLFFILLVFGMSVPSYHLMAYADKTIIAEIHSRAGSDTISTSTLFKERCWVTVDVIISSSHHSTYHRNNPDNTYYPGDAFEYSISTGVDGCRHYQPCPLQSTPNLSSPNGPDRCEPHGHSGRHETPVGGNYGSSSDSGTAEIDYTIKSGDEIYIKKQTFAEQYVCHRTTRWHCGWQTVSAVGNYVPPVIDPNIKVTLEKDSYEFTESDGYTSRNLDKTYYPWDAINVVHTPIYKWKNERVGTLHVVITKDHAPLNLEQEFQCKSASCTNTMTHSGFLPWTGTFDYGSGNTIYNATSLALIGNHDINYNVKLFNISPQIDEVDGSTSALVVEYNPVYDSYVYPVLKDDYSTAFEDRIGIALHYFGSEATPANPDDVTGIHEDRRSKINDYFYSTWGYDPWYPTFLDGTVMVANATDYGVDLLWSEAHDVGIVQNQTNVKMLDDISDKIIETEHSGTIPFEEGRHTTANFVKNGYGKIFFEYPGILDAVLDTSKGIPRFENATVYDTLQSRHFAGYDLKFLPFSEYMYPESLFHGPITVKAVDANGTRDDSVELFLDVSPRFDINATQFLDDYMYEKILFDTGDDGFSQIITGKNGTGGTVLVVNDDDIYPMDENHIAGFGSITLDKTRRTASLFTQYDTILPQYFTDDVGEISDKYLLDSASARLPIPLTTGLYALSPFYINVTASNGSDTVTNIFDGTFYDFGTHYFYTVNISKDNVLDIARDAKNPRVLILNHDPNFGSITLLQINNITMTGDDLPECVRVVSANSCIFPVPAEYKTDELDVSAHNIWNGTSSVILPEISATDIEPPTKKADSIVRDPDISSPFLIVLLFILPIAYWIYKRMNKRKEK